MIYIYEEEDAMQLQHILEQQEEDAWYASQEAAWYAEHPEDIEQQSSA